AAFHHSKTQGFLNSALGSTMAGWWTPRHQLQVMFTDNPAYIEAMAMKWLDQEHGRSKFVGIVMNGAITVDGKIHNAFISRSRTADRSMRMMAYNPYYGKADKQEPWVTPFIDFPADQAVPPETRKALEEIMIVATLGR